VPGAGLIVSESMLIEVLGNLSRFLAAASVALFAVYFYDWTTPFAFKRELSEKDNPAFGVNLAGYIVGVMVLIMGATATATDEISHPLDIAIFGTLAVLLLRLGAVVTDKVILSSFSVWQEITEDRNLGTGFVTAGIFVGTGILLNGALTGESSGILMGILTTIGYFVFAQIVLVGATCLYRYVIKYHHSDGSVHGVLQELRDNDNPAVGLSFAGFIVGVSLVVSAGISGTDINSLSGLSDALITLLFSSVLGVGTMLAIRPFIDRAVIPYASIGAEVGEQKNLAIASVNAAFYVGLGLILYSLTA